MTVISSPPPELDPSPQFLRSDPLTGVGNALAFFEWLLNHSSTHPIAPFTLISLDVKDLEQLNRAHGRSAGDAALRWAALVLLEEAKARVYRISGDEFVGVVAGGSPSSHTEYLDRVSDRLTQEADRVKLKSPAAFVAMIHFTGLEEISPKDVLGVIYGAFLDLKGSQDRPFKVFDAATTIPARDLSGLINDLVRRMISLGYLLDKSQEMAFKDSITGLPNMQSALLGLKSALEKDGKAFTILLIDGDNLGRYNTIGYLAGDEMIRRLGTTLQATLRPGDFIARWRTGDEFFVLLREAFPPDALAIAERLRRSVSETSISWHFPVTISIGIVGFPTHGTSAKELLDRAEEALNQAKMEGKDRAVIADQVRLP